MNNPKNFESNKDTTAEYKPKELLIAEQVILKMQKRTQVRELKKQAIFVVIVMATILSSTSESLAALATQVDSVKNLFRDHIMACGLIIGVAVGGVTSLMTHNIGSFIAILGIAISISFSLSLIENGVFFKLFSK